METANLKEYLKRVYELEKTLYVQRLLYKELGEKMRRASHVQYEQYYGIKEYGVNERKVNSVKIAETMIFLIGGGILIVLALSSGLLYVSRGMVVAFTTILVVMIYFGISFIWSFCYDRNKQKNIDNENIRAQKEDRIIKQKNIVLKKQAENKMQFLQSKIQETVKIYNDTKDVLDTYYGKDIIYPKYRNFIAVAMFYEYICSGRCDSLVGQAGAYNLFENEVRLNIIINKMDIIVEKLDQIQDNQFMLYEAIRDGNQKLEKISQDISNMSRNAESTNAYNASIAYNTEISAQNTEYLKWVEFFKN